MSADGDAEKVTRQKGLICPACARPIALFSIFTSKDPVSRFPTERNCPHCSSRLLINVPHHGVILLIVTTIAVIGILLGFATAQAGAVDVGGDSGRGSLSVLGYVVAGVSVVPAVGLYVLLLRRRMRVVGHHCA